MDRNWFIRRMAELGLKQEHFGAAIGRSRSQSSRILSARMPRELKLREIETCAKLLKVSPVEVLEHAHTWAAPLQNGDAPTTPDIDEELLRHAIERSEAGLRRFVDRDQVFVGTVIGAYRFLANRRSQGKLDDRALEDLEESIRSGLRRP